jgi:protein SCO1
MKKLLVVGLILILGIGVVYQMVIPGEKPLKIYNPVDLDKAVVDSSLFGIGYGHQIQEFEFTDQYGNNFSSSSLKGKVFVAEYFFTTCGSICPKMNVQMQRVQRKFKGNSEVKILSFTVDPKTDTVAQMYRYAINHHAEKGQWYFLTGEKEALYDVARKSFFVLKPAEAENLGDAGSDFIHTNNFVLVDKQLRIRGYFDGTDAKEVERLMHGIEQLLEESIQ